MHLIIPSQSSLSAHPFATSSMPKYTPAMNPAPTPPDEGPSAQAPSADELLAELAAQGAQMGVYGKELAPSTQAAQRRVLAQAAEGGSKRPGIARLRYSHEDCIDRMLTSPGIAEGELAQIYGVTAAWMSIVINSDAFRTRMAARREELIDPMLAASLNERFGALAAKSVEILLEKLNQPAEKISDKLALEAASLGAKAVGLGMPTAPSGPSATDHLASLAHRLVDLNRPAAQAIDVDAREV